MGICMHACMYTELPGHRVVQVSALGLEGEPEHSRSREQSDECEDEDDDRPVAAGHQSDRHQGTRDAAHSPHRAGNSEPRRPHRRRIYLSSEQKHTPSGCASRLVPAADPCSMQASTK